MKARLDRERVVKLHREGLGAKEIADIVGCDVSTVRKAKKAQGLTPNRTERDQLILKLSNDGLSREQIAIRAGCSLRVVWRVRNANNFVSPQFLTPGQLADIEKKLDDGWSFTEIERTTGTSRKTIAHHFPGRGWTQQEKDEHTRTLRLAKEAGVAA